MDSPTYTYIFLSSFIISFSVSSTLSIFPTSFTLCETRSPFPVCSCPMNCGPLHVQIASRQSAQSHCHMTLPARRIVFWILAFTQKAERVNTCYKRDSNYELHEKVLCTCSRCIVTFSHYITICRKVT